jgi:HNH endonuclease
MARTSVSIPTSIWRDPSFVGLTRAGQHLYFLLVTQPETTPAGTLALRPRRWAGFSADGTLDGVEAALAELEQTGWALADGRTGEVAARLLLPPAGHKNLQAALTAASNLQSPFLRLAVLERLADLGHASRAATSSGDPRMARMRLAVYGRDGYTCLHCGWAPIVPDGYDGRHALGVVECDPDTGQYRVHILELDHVHPESLGGRFEADNLQTLCNSCNSRKGARV